MVRNGQPFVVRGSGQPLVLIPGIQGRWEWMRPAVDSLAHHFRVVTFSLHEGPGVLGSETFDSYLEQVDAALAFSGCDRAVVCGVSYGGLIAVRYAATRPERVERLVIASAPSPSRGIDDRLRGYAMAPLRSAVTFVTGAPNRLGREIARALPDRRRCVATAAGYMASTLRYPGSARRMAVRIRRLAGLTLEADARLVRAPTLVITGEPDLDRVVPVADTREYLALVAGSVGVTLERTGHIGLVTRPDAFADTIWHWTLRGSVGSRQ
jgi:pimeloyl-ACP methyl ester carboxylesterase